MSSRNRKNKTQNSGSIDNLSQLSVKDRVKKWPPKRTDQTTAQSTNENSQLLPGKTKKQKRKDEINQRLQFKKQADSNVTNDKQENTLTSVPPKSIEDEDKEKTKAPPSTTQATGQQQSQQQATIADDPLKFDVKSSVGFFTKDLLDTLLNSYTTEDVKKAVRKAWDNGKYTNPNLTFNSVPQIIEAAYRKTGRNKAKKAKEKVKKDNADKSPDIEDAKYTTTVYRADKRNAEQVMQDSGFHGWGGSMSIEHAKSWASNVWIKWNDNQKKNFLQEWKAQTSAESDQTNFVATGESESQKGGNEYRIKIPLNLPERKLVESGKGNASAEKILAPRQPILVHDADTLEESSIIAIAGRDEVVFLTGIATKYIEVFDKESNTYKPIDNADV
ncbi:hypothetical protein [Moorena bouillonii]|uniref:Uncharacterized protein n=1 Tax=Moorena bouillonii PNG TaxID=568701 RepID=A0A1U7N3J9_9CYAN|nr:hypothetical protein [Moorena bouillonii]OLT60527.1 hypothetical protein BJP37_17430 [Moorena bouillonii PNG]